MNTPIRVLFVCKDNVGRSLVAEYLLRDWLAKHNQHDIIVSSCGTDASSDTSSFCFDHFTKLKEMGIDVSKHVRTQVNKELLLQNDICIAMDESHQAYVHEHFGIHIPLYNEIYKNEKTSINIVPAGCTEDLSTRILKTVEYINQSIPQLLRNIEARCSSPTHESPH